MWRAVRWQRRLYTEALAIALALPSCGGGVTNSDGGRLEVVVGVMLTHPEFTPTLQKIEVLWNGQVVGTAENTTAQPNLYAAGATFFISPGTYTVSIRVVRQTVTSATYNIDGEIQSVKTNGAIQMVTLGPQQKTFATGGLVLLQEVTLR